MNDINVIRRALEGHSAALGGTLDDVNRHRQIHDRIDRARKRRNGLRGGIALAVAAVVGAVVIPQLGEDGPGPADRTVLGLQAPANVDAPDHTYRFVEGFEDTSTRLLKVKIEASDTPRILTWATASDDQDVQVRVPDHTAWGSTKADFGDWVEIAPGAEGTIQVASTKGSVGLGAALYEADPSALPDVVKGFHGQYFRAAGPLTVRKAVAIGEPGQVDVRVPVDVAGDRASVVISCDGLPAGLVINYGIGGAERSTTTEDACSGDQVTEDGSSTLTKDLGLVTGWSGFDGGYPEDAEARVWVTESSKDDTPVSAADHPDARLAVAAYEPAMDQAQVTGTAAAFEKEQFFNGHRWVLQETSPTSASRTMDISRYTQDAPALAIVATTVRGKKQIIRTSVLADDREVGDGIGFGLPSGGSGFDYAVVPRGAAALEVTAKTEGEGPAPLQHLAIYRLAD